MVFAGSSQQQGPGHHGKSVRVPGWKSVESRGEAILLQGTIGQPQQITKQSKGLLEKGTNQWAKRPLRARSLLVSIDGDGDHDDLMTSVTMSPCCGLQGFY